MSNITQDQGSHLRGQVIEVGPEQDNRRAALQGKITALRHELAALQAQLDGPKQAWEDYPLLLSVQDLAEITGFSAHTIRDWCEQELLPAEKIGNRWRLERDRARMALKNLDRRRRRKRHG